MRGKIISNSLIYTPVLFDYYDIGSNMYKTVVPLLL